ncbi:MAG: class I SAM-dependent methyltransferase [Lachnospirales bacterium]
MKLNIELSGVPETMLIPLYARAIESKKSKPAFYDKYAIDIIESIDYDFSNIAKGKMSLWGCAARTIILDREVKSFISENPNCTCINLGCGLDARFHRVDNGKINWYNVDFQSIADLRDKFLPKMDREEMLISSALDKVWIDKVNKKNEILIIMEGLSMYFTEEEVKDFINMTKEAFPNCTILIELLSEFSWKNQKTHDTLKYTTAVFKWGVKEARELEILCPYAKLIDEWNYTPIMKQFSPVFITLISPILKNFNNRIGKFLIYDK